MEPVQNQLKQTPPETACVLSAKKYQEKWKPRSLLFLWRSEVCIFYFHFLLQSTFICIIFCYDQIYVYM